MYVRGIIEQKLSPTTFQNRIYTNIYGVIFRHVDYYTDSELIDTKIIKALGRLPAKIIFDAHDGHVPFQSPVNPQYRQAAKLLRANSYLRLGFPRDVNRRLEAIYSEHTHFRSEQDGKTGDVIGQAVVGKIVWIDHDADGVNYNCQGLDILNNPDFMAIKTDENQGLSLGQVAEIADFLAVSGAESKQPSFEPKYEPLPASVLV